MIYFIEAVGADLMKIGFTDRNVGQRLKELQTASPHRLRVLATIVGELSLEAMLHQQFKHLRTSGEWFKIDDELRFIVFYAKWVWPRFDDIIKSLQSVILDHERLSDHCDDRFAKLDKEMPH